jgi:hypothetical protein
VVLQLLRDARLPAVLALLVVTGSVPISIGAMLHETDDAACRPSLVQHDEAAHRIGAPRPIRTVPQHCAVCHWLKSLQTVVAASPVAAPASAVTHLSISSLLQPDVRPVGEIPARAPPYA